MNNELYGNLFSCHFILPLPKRSAGVSPDTLQKYVNDKRQENPFVIIRNEMIHFFKKRLSQKLPLELFINYF